MKNRINIGIYYSKSVLKTPAITRPGRIKIKMETFEPLNSVKVENLCTKYFLGESIVDGEKSTL